MTKAIMDIEAIEITEKVQGTVQCFNCDYFGKMDGYIEYNNQKYIKFVCPECSAIEKVNSVW